MELRESEKPLTQPQSPKFSSFSWEKKKAGTEVFGVPSLADSKENHS